MSISLPTAFKINLKIPYGELQHVVEWCDRNCKDEWRYMEDPNGDAYDSWIFTGYPSLNSWIFFFENERDYVAFTMWNKW